MAAFELTRLQEQYDAANARCEAASAAIRGLGFEASGPLLPGQAAPVLSPAQVAALAELREADDAAVAARTALSDYLTVHAIDAER